MSWNLNSPIERFVSFHWVPGYSGYDISDYYPAQVAYTVTPENGVVINDSTSFDSTQMRHIMTVVDLSNQADLISLQSLQLTISYTVSDRARTSGFFAL